MDTQYLNDSRKSRKIFKILLVFSALGYLLLIAGIFRSLLAGLEEHESLVADSASLLTGVEGQERLLRVSGAGFDDTVRATLSYDAGNRGAIVATLKTWSHLNQVVVRGDKAFLANQHRGLQVLDVGDPRHPKFIGTVDTPGLAWGVCLDGDFAYVADGPAGLQIVSVADPSQPRLVGSIKTPRSALAVEKLGRVLLVAGQDSIFAIAVDSPGEPKILHSLVVGGMAQGLAVRDEQIFLANGRAGVAVLAFDLQSGFRLVKKLESCSDAQQVSVSERWLLVGCGTRGVAVFDFEGTDPRYLATLDTPGFARGVAAAGNRIYVADNNHGIQILEAIGQREFRHLQTVEIPGNVWGVTPARGFIFAAAGNSGLQIVESSLSAHLPVPTLETAGVSWGIASRGNQLYLADGQAGVKIIEVEPAGGLRIAAALDTPGFAKRLDLCGDWLYVADLNGGLLVLDIRIPGELRIAGTVKIPGGEPALAVSVGKELACVAIGRGGLVVLDITDSGEPRVVGRLAGLGYVKDVVLAGDRAFLVAGQEGLLQVSVKDPENPVLIGKVELPGHLQLFANATGISVSGDRLLLANSRAGCQVYDIGGSGQPRLLSSLATMDNVVWVKGIGDHAFLFSHVTGLQVVDLSDPRQPRSLGVLGTSSNAMDIAIVGNEACVSLGKRGLKVLPLPVEVPGITVNSSRELILQMPRVPQSGNHLLTLFRGRESAILERPLALQPAVVEVKQVAGPDSDFSGF
jgi:hypothetical protein